MLKSSKTARIRATTKKKKKKYTKKKKKKELQSFTKRLEQDVG